MRVDVVERDLARDRGPLARDLAAAMGTRFEINEVGGGGFLQYGGYGGVAVVGVDGVGRGVVVAGYAGGGEGVAGKVEGEG